MSSRHYSISRLNATPAKMQHLPNSYLLSLNTYKMVNEQDMEKALAELESSEEPNYTATAKKYHLVPSTLIRRA